ncbi:MAG: glycosyltransferase family 4 protein [Burkholderiales bacterium]
MRILMLSPSTALSGGVIDFVRILTANLSPATELVTTTVGSGDSRLPMLVRLLRDGWALLRTIRRVRPDVVQLNPSLDRAIVRDGMYLLLTRLVHRGPLVVFIHGWNERWEARIRKSKLLRGAFCLVFARADRVYVLATRFREELASWGLPADRLRATSMLFDGAQFNGLARQRPLPSAADELQVLFMSRLVPDKGAKETLQAFAVLAHAVPGIRLVCAGDGPEKAELERWANAHGISDRVHFPGFVRGASKAQLLLDSDLFVFPTHYGEGCPVSLLEAMGAGLPVITARSGGIADVFSNGSNGVLLDTRPDAQAVARALSEMTSNVEAMRRMGRDNHRLAFARYEAGTWCRALESDFASMN